MSARRGVFVFLLLVALLGSAVLVAALSMRPSTRPAGPSVLVFDVPTVLEEVNPPLRVFPFAQVRRSRHTVYEVVRALDRAAEDDRVRGLVLHVDGLEWGWGKVAEVRDAVLRVRAAGKPVYASLTGGSEREYLLATAADVVCMPPTETLQLDGLSLSALYFRGAFDKFGISPNFSYVGRFKSGVEPYTRSGMSESAREALEDVLDGLYGLLVDSLATARGLDRDTVASLIDRGPHLAGEALERGLLDTLLYDPEVDSLATREGSDRPLATMSFARYAAADDGPFTGPRVALVTASGAIVPGRSRDLPGDEGVLGAETLVDALRDARTRGNVRAIVLRIDSPGGDAQASDDIWREVERCRAVKPVIVSMSDYGASGGYYIAVGADSIVAQPATLTGSIGIYGGKLNVLGLMQKLGLNVETVSRGRHAQMLSPYRDFNADEAAAFRHGLESFYAGFLERVRRGRGLEAGEVDSLAQGRVWMGTAARERGLVDGLGGLDVALEMARRRAGLPEDRDLAVEQFPKVERGFLERLIEQMLDPEDASVLAELRANPVLRAWLVAARFPSGAALALMPFTLEIR